MKKKNLLITLHAWMTDFYWERWRRRQSLVQRTKEVKVTPITNNQRWIHKLALETNADPWWNHSQNSAPAANANIATSKIKWSSSDELIQDLYVYVKNAEKTSIANSMFSEIRDLSFFKCGHMNQTSSCQIPDPGSHFQTRMQKHIKHTAKQRGMHGCAPPHAYII